MVIMFGRIGVVFGNLIIPVLDRISCELPYMTLAMFNFCKETNNIFYFSYGQYYTKKYENYFYSFFSMLGCHTNINEDKKRKTKNNHNFLICTSSSVFWNATISKAKISNKNKLLKN